MKAKSLAGPSWHGQLRQGKSSPGVLSSPEPGVALSVMLAVPISFPPSHQRKPTLLLAPLLMTSSVRVLAYRQWRDSKCI